MDISPKYMIHTIPAISVFATVLRKVCAYWDTITITTITIIIIIVIVSTYITDPLLQIIPLIIIIRAQMWQQP